MRSTEWGGRTPGKSILLGAHSKTPEPSNPSPLGLGAPDICSPPQGGTPLPLRKPPDWTQGPCHPVTTSHWLLTPGPRCPSGTAPCVVSAFPNTVVPGGQGQPGPPGHPQPRSGPQQVPGKCYHVQTIEGGIHTLTDLGASSLAQELGPPEKRGPWQKARLRSLWLQGPILSTATAITALQLRRCLNRPTRGGGS